MASNIRSFVAAIENWVEDTPKAVSKMQRGIMLGMLRDVAIETPVDTGRARANWQVGRETEPRGTIEAWGGAPAAEAVSRGSAKIAKIRPFSVSYVANNLPYIRSLNDGHSNQAPSGYVDAVFERYRTRFGRS